MASEGFYLIIPLLFHLTFILATLGATREQAKRQGIIELNLKTLLHWTLLSVEEVQ